MYNRETYEEYIRNILGYPNYHNSHFENNNYYVEDDRNREENHEMEECYPEIYHIVYPMIVKACSNNTKPVTPARIDELTEEIYKAIGTENEIKVNINLNNQTTSNNNRSTVNSSMRKENITQKPQENRQFRNNPLKDLIKILLIRELVGNRPQRPPRPPIVRPPFPGGGPGSSLPIMPRDRY